VDIVWTRRVLRNSSGGSPPADDGLMNYQLTYLLLKLPETSRARKLIFGLYVNIDKANSRRYDVTR